MTTRTKCVCGILVALLMLGLVVHLVLPARTAATQVALQFCGIPAASPNGQSTLCLSNSSDAAVVYGALAPQEKLNGQWSDSLPVLRTVVGRGIIRPHHAATIVVTTPTNGESWRVPISWSYAPTKLQVLTVRAQNLITRKQQSLTSEGFTAYSPEVTP